VLALHGDPRRRANSSAATWDPGQPASDHREGGRSFCESDPLSTREAKWAACPHFFVRSEREGSVERLTPTGELDIATTPILERAFDEARNQEDAAVIVVDLTQLSFMDVSGIHLLERVNAVCVEADQLRIIDRSPAVKRLFDIAGCRDWLPIIDEDVDPLPSPRAPATPDPPRNLRVHLTGNSADSGRLDSLRCQPAGGRRG
jgi:anti-anti-sigma factor